MSTTITEKDVRHIAKLGRLKCSDDEIKLFTGQIGTILEYVAKLGEVDTSDVEPLAHCMPIKNVFREDEIKPSLSNDEALANSPQRDGEFFAVPRVLGDSGC